MPSKSLVSGMVFVFLIALLVSMVEYFVPISKKRQMDLICRRTLLRMEVEGTLTEAMKDELISSLEEKGFTGIIVHPAGRAKYGDEISLHVEAEYAYSKLSGIFVRRNSVQKMVYSKTTIVRKVVN